MNQKTKQQVQIEQQILYTLSQIIEMFPQYSVVQHFVHIMRKKSELQEVYFWNDELFLNKVENYYDELKTDLVLNKTEENV